MKVNSDRDISFKSIYTNRALKKTFEFASDKPAIFAAGASLTFAMLRPLSIWATPNTEKENRKLACAKSIVSSFLNFGVMLGISQPINHAIDKIDKAPENYMKKESVNFYKNGSKNITGSKRYVFASQLFKLGIMAAVAIPKAMMTASAIPYLIKAFDYKNRGRGKRNDNTLNENKIVSMASNPSFKGNESFAKKIGNIFNKKGIKDFADKYKDSNFVMHIIALTDALTTLTFIEETKRSKKIKDERKKALMYNAGISTALCIGSGYVADKLLDKPTEKFIEKYKKLNINERKLDKQVQGIKITKPLLILGTIYYILIPLISTYLAEKVDKNSKNELNKIDKHI